jgi:hypothetical protein
VPVSHTISSFPVQEQTLIETDEFMANPIFKEAQKEEEVVDFERADDVKEECHIN